MHEEYILANIEAHPDLAGRCPAAIHRCVHKMLRSKASASLCHILLPGKRIWNI